MWSEFAIAAFFPNDQLPTAPKDYRDSQLIFSKDDGKDDGRALETAELGID
jgi:hypothetical protein